jgi:hypothetical protein
MERLLTVEFGPSRSKRFGKALDEARRLACELSEIEPGKYRVRFLLDTDSAAYTGLARLLERVRHWRATEVCEGDEPVSAYHAKEMAWCASSQLKSYGACRFRFVYGVFPRCSLCPLFDGERAIRDVLGEHPPPGAVLGSPSARTFAPCSRESSSPTSTRPLRSPTSRQPSGENKPARNHQAEDPQRGRGALNMNRSPTCYTRAREGEP